MYLWSLYTTKFTQPVHKGILDYDTDDIRPHGVKVVDLKSAMTLWQQGFFGKGSLSRSEPSWFNRTARRLGFDGGELTLEEVTEMRRQKRRAFKKERERQQHNEHIEKMKAEGKEITPEMIKQTNSTNTTNTTINDDTNGTSTPGSNTRQEDLNLVRGDTIVKLEYLQLNPYESVFLSLGLGVLQVDNTNCSELLSTMLPNIEYFHKYLVYHYFRSLGWCVRDGVKFGVDMLIYRRGPPFQHAEFTVMVVKPGARLDWWWIHANMRVVSGAKKTLMLIYIDGPEELPNWNEVKTIKQFRNKLKSYKLKPVVFSRFTPARNRG